MLPDKIRLLALDFDGVLTDDRVMVSEDGTESVFCSRADGLGLRLLRQAGVQTVLLSTETNPVVSVRARKLDLAVFQGLEDKAQKLRQLADERRLDLGEVVFVGNDVNDVECLKMAGWAVVPADAHPAAAAQADLILKRPGGRGAVRELADLILAARNAEAAVPEVSS